MPALNPTDYYCDIVWLGQVYDPASGIQSTPIDVMTLGFAGPNGEAHGGLTRPSCSRVLSQHPRGTEIRNVRQLSIVSQEELIRLPTKSGCARSTPCGWGVYGGAWHSRFYTCAAIQPITGREWDNDRHRYAKSSLSFTRQSHQCSIRNRG